MRITTDLGVWSTVPRRYQLALVCIVLTGLVAAIAALLGAYRFSKASCSRPMSASRSNGFLHADDLGGEASQLRRLTSSTRTSARN
jgi:hypothetical protein